MNYKKYIKEQQFLYNKGFKEVQEKRLEWYDLEKRARAIFEDLIVETNTQEFFEFLYIDDHKKFAGKVKTNQHFINLRMGSHANGIFRFKSKESILDGELSVEKGGMLLISQGPQGEVLVLLYPCTSEELNINSGTLTWNIYKRPNDLSDKKIKRAVRMFFRYCYISSFIGEITIWDRFIIFFIKARVNLDIFIFGKVFLKVIEKVTGIGSDIVGIEGK